MSPRRGIKRKKQLRRRVTLPSRPPPISINPWRKVTLSVEDEGTNNDKCVTQADVVKALKEQLAISISQIEIRLHRVRCWNRGRPPYNTKGVAGYDIEIPAVNGPLMLSTCDLVSNMAKNDCSVTFLRTIESYPGKTSWAKASYTWNGANSRLILSNDKAVLFVWRAPANETVVFHIIVSYRAKSTGSFKESTLRAPTGMQSISTAQATAVDAAGSPSADFVRLGLSSDRDTD